MENGTNFHFEQLIITLLGVLVWSTVRVCERVNYKTRI